MNRHAALAPRSRILATILVVVLFALPTVAQAATDRAHPAPSPVAKKKHRFFDPDELHKDRSLPAGDKVPMTDDKPRKRQSLSEQLHKDRSNEK